MSEASVKIQMMRDQQLTRGLRAAALLGLITVVCSLSRAWFTGWHDIMYLHIAIYLLIVAAAFMNQRLSFLCRAAIILGVCYILGASSLLIWGFGAFSLPALFCFSILSTILFGSRAGIWACIISIMTVAATGALVWMGIVGFDYDAAAHLNSPITWLVVILEVALLAGTIVVFLGTLNLQLEGLARNLEKQNRELLDNNLLLRAEIADRIRAEEERQKLSSRLQAAEKMEAIGTLAGGVAHDLNNILGGIVGYPDLLLTKLPENSPMRGPLEEIRKTGMKAAVIVNDLLTLARRRLETVEPVNLNSVISEYCSSPEFGALKQYHPKVQIEIHSDPHLMNILGSPFHLSKVLMNLVSNAAEAMPEGGRIVISTGNRQVTGEDCIEGLGAGAYSMLSVSDTGMGIPAEDVEKIFEPFYSKKKLGRSGTGLGMAVVWSSVKDHNGHIVVKSALGEGTRFDLYFPCTTEQKQEAKSLFAGTDYRGKGEFILIVDDVWEQREITSRIIEELGYSVYAVGSGEEAVEYLQNNKADLLILDMLMEPGMDGLETYRRVVEIHPGQKAIMTTGFAETERIKEALQSGVGRCLKKPYLVDEIGFAIKAELTRTSG